MLAALVALEWTRPLGGIALALPVLVYLLSRRDARARPELTGTIEVWREAAPEAAIERASAARRRPPWVALAALTLGALALAGPRDPSTLAPRRWRLVLDRTPSMFLAVDSGASGPTRIERAVASARALVASEREPEDELEWLAYDGDALARAEGDAPPQSWLHVPRAPLASPPWERVDEPGAIWITDAEPASRRRKAGLALSGGDAVPGPIATRGGTRIDWDGERAIEIENALEPGRVEIGRGVPEPIERVVSAWARSRALAVERDATKDPELRIARIVGAGPALQVSGGRDGWLGSGLAQRAPSSEVDASTAWLRARPQDGSDELDLVRWRPGLVEIAWSELSEPEGDPAAFAVSWADLLDRALLPGAEVVPLSERLGAGEARVLAPKQPPARRTKDGMGARGAIDAWLAAAAAVLGLIALALRR